MKQQQITSFLCLWNNTSCLRTIIITCSSNLGPWQQYRPIPLQLSVAFPCFHSCFVLLLEGEVCAGLISITVSSFPITPQTPAGCLFTFRNKKWSCTREDVPLIRGEAPRPKAPHLRSSSPRLFSSYQRQSQSCDLSLSLSVFSPHTLFHPLSLFFPPCSPPLPTVQLSNHIK